MIERIKNKLRSRSGASLMFALLLFLVCAVISSVVLAAGTAASGRMSETAANDQRYFSVTSAAELLRDLFDGVTVCVVEADDGKIYVFEGAMAYEVNESYIEQLKSDSNADSIDPDDPSAPTFSSLPMEAAYMCAESEDLTPVTSRFSISYSGEGYESLAVKVVDNLQPVDGTITFTVSNDLGNDTDDGVTDVSDDGTTGEATGTIYTLRLSLSADILHNEYYPDGTVVSTSGGDEADDGESGGDDTDDEATGDAGKIVVTSYTWRVNSIQTVGAIP